MKKNTFPLPNTSRISVIILTTEVTPVGQCRFTEYHMAFRKKSVINDNLTVWTHKAKPKKISFLIPDILYEYPTQVGILLAEILIGYNEHNS